MQKEVMGRLPHASRYMSKGKTSIKIRVFDWSGHNAIGDDLLAYVTQQSLEKAAASLNARIEFNRSGSCHANVCGGGTILGHGLFFNQVALRIAFDNKPYIVFGSGARKPERELNVIERFSLRRFCVGALQIGVRGEGTKTWLESHGIERVEIIGDAALAFEPIETPGVAGEFKLGVNLRHMGGGLLTEEQSGSNRKNALLFARLCDEIVRRYNAKLYFFDFCRNRFDNDMIAIQNVLANMVEKKAVADTTIVAIEENRDPIVAYSRLGRMDFMLSQRMHPSLMAWVQGVPSIGMEYQFGKTYDAFNALGLQSQVMDIADIDVGRYIEKMSIILEQKHTLVERCLAKVENLKTRQHQFLQRFLSALPIR